jgi:agmatinase
VRLRLSDAVRVERAGDDGAVLRHGETGCRLRVGAPLYRFLCCFKRPRAPEDVFPGPPPAPAERFLARMLRLGFLEDADGLGGRARAPGCGATALRLFAVPAPEAAADAAIAVLGVPYEGGSAAGGGAAAGAGAIRAASQQLAGACDPETGRPLGWYDHDRGEWILRGVVLADHGDLRLCAGEPQEAVFARLTRAVAVLLARGALPVALGGDHSLSLAVLRAFGERRLSVVHFDAHTDCSPGVRTSRCTTATSSRACWRCRGWSVWCRSACAASCSTTLPRWVTRAAAA